MKKQTSILGILVLFFVLSLHFQGFAQKKDKNNQQPKVDIKVNKELDENGNIIRYDSTYTYSYSFSGDEFPENFPDSLFGSMPNFFFDFSPLDTENFPFGVPEGMMPENFFKDFPHPRSFDPDFMPFSYEELDSLMHTPFGGFPLFNPGGFPSIEEFLRNQPGFENFEPHFPPSDSIRQQRMPPQMHPNTHPQRSKAIRKGKVYKI